MDISNISAEDIAKMTEEERREYVRELLRAKGDSGIRAAFYNPQLDQTVDMHEMVKHIGEEATIDLVCKALASQDTQKQTITKEQFDELKKKHRTGQKLTEEEERILHMVESSLMDSDQVQYQKNTTGTVLSIIEFAQQVPKYNPTFSDLVASINMILLSGLAAKEGTQTYNYHDDFGTLADISERIGNDILDTWKASCTSEVSPEMTAIGLAFALMRVLAESGYEFPKGAEMFEVLGLDMDQFMGEEEEEIESENGSNILTPNVYSDEASTPDDEDENMRNLLKE